MDVISSKICQSYITDKQILSLGMGNDNDACFTSLAMISNTSVQDVGFSITLWTPATSQGSVLFILMYQKRSICHGSSAPMMEYDLQGH